MYLEGKSLTAIDFGGLRIFDYTAGQSWSSSLARIEVPPGVRHARAWSTRSDKFYLVVSGEILFTLDAEQRRLVAGDFCFVPKGSRFHYSNDTSTAATLVLVHTPGFELESEVFAGE